MQEIIDLRNEHSFLFQPGLPKGYKGLILKGAIAISHQTPSGSIVLQHFQRTDFAIQLSVFHFLRLVHCFLRPPVFPTTSILALKTELKSRISELGSFRLRENEFSVLHYDKESMLADFKADKEYQFLEISCSPEMLGQTLHHFPKLENSFQQAANQSTASIIIPQRPASGQILKIADEILHSRFDAGTNEIYIEDKIREYVWSMMMDTLRIEEPKVPLNESVLEQLRAMGARMQQDPHGKFPIPKLAREMAMNVMTFKVAFKQVFGKGVFEFHLDQRMKEANRLLKNSGLPIKKIASLVGYELTTSFITKFIEYFGYPPSDIQNK